MKKVHPVVVVLFLIALTACSDGSKKVLIMASGKLTVNEKEKNIKLEPGTTHNEREITLTGSEKETLTVESPDGNKTYDVPEKGLYVLNLKPDTLVGGMVRYGTGERTSNLTGEDVDHIIDSTQKLMTGENASDDKKTYFIVPFSVKKLSANPESSIIGPYSNIPGSVDMDASGKGPEMYKLFTNKQKRESVEELIMERKK